MRSILPNQWLKLSIEDREKVAQAFNLKKSTGMEIVNNQIVCDGYTAKDLLVLNDESMRKFLGTSDATGTLETLFTLVTQKLNGKEVEASAAQGSSPEPSESPKRKGREGVKKETQNIS